MRKSIINFLLYLRKNSSFLAVLLVGVVSVWVSSNINWGRQEDLNSVIMWDAKGYYAYLPAFFIYHDLNFSFYDSVDKPVYSKGGLDYDYRRVVGGNITDKYFCGTALMQLPFFLIAHVISLLSDEPPDGFSKFYAIAINLAGVFYFLIGLLFLIKTLKFFGGNNFLKVVVILAAAFGTNAFYYATKEPGISHIYSFALFNIFIFLSLCYFQTPSNSQLFKISAIIGLIILVRPVNGLIVFSFPFLGHTNKQFRDGLKYIFLSVSRITLSLIIIIGILFIQLLIYKLETGNFFIYTYTSERLDMLKPHLLSFLFSYRKGAFVYTPLYFLSLLGLIFWYKKKLYWALSFSLFILLVVYIQSCWFQWWYGGSFGSRVLVEFIPFMMLPIFSLFNEARKIVYRLPLLIIVFALVVVCQIQTFQYRHMIIHWDSMNKKAYWYVFMKIRLNHDEQIHLADLLQKQN